MPVGTSLGEGIGLQEQRRDNYWMGRIADDNAKKDAAEAKEREKADKALTTAMDFKWDAKGYLPAWGNAIAGIYSKAVNNMVAQKQGSKYIPQPIIQNEGIRAKQEASKYIEANERAKQYVSSKGIYKDPDVVRAMTSADTDFNTLSELTKNHPFIRVGPQGEFSYYEIPAKRIDYKFPAPDMMEIETLKKEGRSTFRAERLDYSPESLAMASEALTADPAWSLQTLQSLYKTDPVKYGKSETETLEQYFKRLAPELAGIADEEAMRLKPPATYGRVFPELALAPSGGGGNKDVKKPIISDVNGKIKVSDYSGVLKEGEDPSREIIINVGQPQVYEIEYDKSINIPDSKAVTINLNDEIYALNPRLKEEGVTQISFKPNNILRVRQKDGYKLIALGNEVLDAVKEDGTPVQIKSFKPYIPYETVKGSVELSYGSDVMQSIYEELEIGKKSQKKSTTSKLITVTIDGKTGQIDESQWSAFKKKYPKATRQ